MIILLKHGAYALKKHAYVAAILSVCIRGVGSQYCHHCVCLVFTHTYVYTYTYSCKCEDAFVSTYTCIHEFICVRISTLTMLLCTSLSCTVCAHQDLLTYMYMIHVMYMYMIPYHVPWCTDTKYACSFKFIAIQLHGTTFIHVRTCTHISCAYTVHNTCSFWSTPTKFYAFLQFYAYTRARASRVSTPYMNGSANHARMNIDALHSDSVRPGTSTLHSCMSAAFLFIFIPANGFNRR